jgi:hypothetical protein
MKSSPEEAGLALLFGIRCGNPFNSCLADSGFLE